MTVETRYFRSDTHTVNGLTANKLSDTSDTAPSASTGEIWASSPKTAYVYFEFKVRHADGSTTDLKSFQRSYSENIDQDVTVEVSIPLTALEAGDAIQVYVELYVSGTQYYAEYFITEQLGASRLNSATWKVIYYIHYWKNYTEAMEPTPWVTVVEFRPKRIENFTYDEPVNFSRELSDAIGISDVIEKARISWKKTLEERVKLNDLMNFLKTSGGGPTNWLEGWQYRKKHDINGSTAGAVTDYQIRIKVHYGSGTDSGEDVYLNEKCRSDFGDVRFTTDDGTTLLDYWMEEKVDGDYAIFWVKVPNIPASPNKATVYIYYGKSDATYAGDGEATFDFFDDFDTLDTDKWEIWATASVSDSILTLKRAGSSDNSIASYATVSEGKAMHFYAKYSLGSIYDTLNLGFTNEHDAGRVEGDQYATMLYVDRGYTNKERLRDRVNNTSYNADLQAKSDDTWRKWALKWLANKQILECITTGASTLLEYTLTGSYYVKISSKTGSAIWYVDWLFVRKYVDPEPSHGDWYAEETAPVAVNYELTLSEALGAYDSYLRSWSAVKPLPDQIGAYDAVTPLRKAGKLIRDYIGLLDSLSRHPASLRADSLAALDIYATVRSLYRYLSDAVGVHDYKLFAVEAYVSDIVALHDTTSRHSVSYIGDFINLSDRFSSYIFGKISLTDGIGLYDALAKVFTAHRTYSEKLGTYDALVTVKVQFRSFTEIASLADAVSKSTHITRDELVGLSDVIEKVFTAYREYVDDIGLLDAVSKQTSRALADYTRLYDVASKAISRLVEDSAALSDLVERHPAVLVADSVSLYDVFERWWTAHKEVVEAVGLFDVLTPVKALFEVFSEPMALADVFARKWDVKREYSESVELYDEVTRRWGKWILLTESIAAYDEEYLLRLRKAIARILAPERVLPAFREQSPDRVQGPSSE